MSFFPPLDSKKSVSQTEEEILSFWKKENIFQKTVDSRSKERPFVFFDGPPFATGLPHYGHMVGGTLKDAIPRYYTMKGYRVERKWGWDCHGVPVEFQVEKEHRIGGKPGIEKMGIGKFNELCRSVVLRCRDDWEATVDRMGRFVDFQDDYKTMDPEFMESVWWVFSELWKKGLIYEGEKVVPYSPKLGSPLSNFEANLNYKDIDDPAVTVKFELEDEPGTYLLAWTTTPWTLPSNLGLVVHPEMEYVKLKLQVYEKDGVLSYVPRGNRNNLKNPEVLSKPIASTKLLSPECLIISKNYYEENLNSVFSLGEKTFIKGSELIGKKYKPVFPFFKGRKNAHQVFADDFVSDTEGTGIVHMAPTGEDDARILQANGVELVYPFTDNCFFDFTDIETHPEAAEDVKELQDRYFRSDLEVEGSKEYNANDWVLAELKGKGLLFKREQIRHSYPHCWRTECALMYRGIKTWFVNVQKIKDQLLEQNKNINWIPSYLKDGRFAKGLENAPDWAISRNRYWGTPIPVWRCDKTGEVQVIGSREELEKLSGKKVTDLHRHFIDDLTWKNEETGGVMRRIPEVLDCWFESGSMPYASKHYPFEEQDKTFQPADFIAEGLDQTRCWFYNLHVLGVALFGTNVYKNVITNGIVLAEDGAKMSKSKKNYPDPNLVFEKYGADAMRFYLLNSPVARGENLRFSEKGVEEVLKSVILPLRSAYQFFSTYANIDGWKPKEFSFLPCDILDDNPENSDSREKGLKHTLVSDLDRWIVSELQTLIREYRKAFDSYDLEGALKLVPVFIDKLNNWYLRRSRRRFWADGMSNEKRSGYETLHYVLLTLSKILAPVCPFVAEKLYKDLKGGESVHLESFPCAVSSWIDTKTEDRVNLSREIVGLAAGIRSRKKIKLRQPLGKLRFVSVDGKHLDLEVIKAEANVKEVEILKSTKGIAQQIIRIDAKKVGPRLGAKVQVLIKAGKDGEYESLEDGRVEVGGEVLEQNEYEMGFVCEVGVEADANSRVLVLLDTEITEGLKVEGTARELIRAIQDLRKSSDFDVSDRISLHYKTDSDDIKKAFEVFGLMIFGEVLAEEVIDGGPIDTSLKNDVIEVDGEDIILQVEKFI